MSKTYYKIVSDGTYPHCPRLSSCCQRVEMNECMRVQYIENEWVKPKLEGTKLFLFNSFDDAKAFAHNELFEGFQIWECEAEGVEAKRGSRGLIEFCMTYWQTNGEQGSAFYNIWPRGTYVADKIKLTKRII